MRVARVGRWSMPLGLFALAWTAASACSSNEPAVRAVGEGCYVPTDCTDPLVCVFQRCHQQCLSDRDCKSGETCTGALAPKTGVCLFQDESQCQRTADCQPPLVCGRHDACELQCIDGRECLASQVCDHGTCVDPSHTPDGGGPVIAPGTRGDSCQHARDCALPLVCLNGRCDFECVDDRDCRSFEHCEIAQGDKGGSCRSGGPSDAGADVGTDGGSDALGDGAVDVGTDAGGDAHADAATSCIADGDCDDGVFCNGVERCNEGVCGAGADPCASHVGCIKDGCDEATKKCSHTPVPGKDLDADGDGYVDLGCGGTDCNDKDKTVYPGAVELCDAKDNNCDGKIDNGAVLSRGTPWVNHPDTTYGKRTSMWLSSLDGRTLLLTENIATSTIAYRIFGETFDASGGSSGEKVVFTDPARTYFTSIDDVVPVGTSTMLVHATGNNDHVARLVASDLTTTWATTFYNGPGSTNGASAAFDGTQWFLVWGRYVSSYAEMTFQFMGSDGALVAAPRIAPTADGKGTALLNRPIRTGVIGTTHAIAFQDAAGAELLLLGAAGDKITSVKVSAFDTGGVFYDMVTTPGGFLVTWGESAGPVNVTLVSPTGVKGTPTTVSSATGSSSDFKLGFDGTKSVVAINDSAKLRLEFGPLGLAGPIETIYPPWLFGISNADPVGLAVYPGQYDLYLFSKYPTAADNLVHGVRLGCAP